MKHRALLGLVLVTTLAAYLPALGGEFVFDDLATISNRLVVDPFASGPGGWFSTARP
jgi:hypothetical protein